jgi:perosamine synthetase
MFKTIKEKELGSCLGKEEIKILTKVINDGNTLTRGPYLEKFEKKFAKMSGSKFAVAVSSCTAALRISTQLLRISKNQEVLVQANAFWKTVVALIEKEAKIKIIDTNKKNLQISFDDLKKKISKKTKALFIVPLGGYTDNINKIFNYCKKKKIIVVQDAAHSVFYYLNNKPPGKFGDINCFSFSTLKNITTLGEGGMLTTNDPKFADEAKKLRDGWPIGSFKKITSKTIDPNLNINFLKPGDYFNNKWLKVKEIGSTYKMNDAQAAVGIVQLKKLKKFLLKRKKIANIYYKFLKKYNFFQLQKYSKKLNPSYHLFSFFVKKNNFFSRNEFVNRLEKKYNLIITNRYWPIHMNSIFKMRGHKTGEAKNFEKIYFSQQIDLPISAIMNLHDVKRITKRLENCIDSFKSEI